MKKIKELCLRELTKLDDSQLLSIITDTQEEENEEEKEEEEEDEEEREMDEGVNEAICMTTVYEQSSSEEEGKCPLVAIVPLLPLFLLLLSIPMRSVK